MESKVSVRFRPFEDIQQEFVHQYWCYPFDMIVSVDEGLVRHYEPGAPDADDPCIVVYISAPLPLGYVLPATFENLRVYVVRTKAPAPMNTTAQPDEGDIK